MKKIMKAGSSFLVFATLLFGCSSSNDTTVTPGTGTSSDITTVMAATATTTTCASSTGVAKMVCLAEAFKATLDATQLAGAQLAYTKTDAVKWSNFPQGATNPKRVGVGLGTLNATQLAAARDLLSAVLTQGVANEGYDELLGVLAADDYYSAANNNSALFGASYYYIAFLGTPSATGLWELQYGGHHFAVSNTYNGGKATGFTPSFRGADPLAAVTLNAKTYQAMGQEQKAFADMLAGLSSTEKTTAKLSTSFSDILLGPGKDGRFPTTRQGIKVSSLTAAEKTLVLDAIKLYARPHDGLRRQLNG